MMKTRKILIVITTLIVLKTLIFSNAISKAAETKSTPNKKKIKTSLTMDETKIEGEVEKPEFISIIQRRRVEFKKKGELNVSFLNKIFEPVEKKKFEDDYSRKFNKVLDTGSVTVK